MKKILILVLSCDQPPYDKMIQTAQNTWDSVEAEGMETVFYCGRSFRQNTDKIIYLPVRESLNTMGEKFLLALEWALANKEFDYIARPHSCIYVDKKELRKYIDTLPETKVLSGLQVLDENPWLWGGCGFVLSKDVAQDVVANKDRWQHNKMEDMALSMITQFECGVSHTQGRGCSIDKKSEGEWTCISYGTPGFDFTDFADMKKAGQYFIRVKQDGARHLDEMIMNELFKHLQ